MKTYIFIMGYVLISIIALTSCSEETKNSGEHIGQFSLSFNHNYEIPSNCYAFITVKDIQGKTILNQHKIQLVKFGDLFITENTNLPIGDYILSDITFKKGKNKNISFFSPRLFVIAKNEQTHIKPYIQYIKKHNERYAVN